MPADQSDAPRLKYAMFSGPHPTLAVDCPSCGSPAGFYCHENGRPIDGPHQTRRVAAGTAALDQKQLPREDS